MARHTPPILSLGRGGPPKGWWRGTTHKAPPGNVRNPACAPPPATLVPLPVPGRNPDRSSPPKFLPLRGGGAERRRGRSERGSLTCSREVAKPLRVRRNHHANSRRLAMRWDWVMIRIPLSRSSQVTFRQQGTSGRTALGIRAARRICHNQRRFVHAKSALARSSTICRTAERRPAYRCKSDPGQTSARRLRLQIYQAKQFCRLGTGLGLDLCRGGQARGHPQHQSRTNRHDIPA